MNTNNLWRLTEVLTSKGDPPTIERDTRSGIMELRAWIDEAIRDLMQLDSELADRLAELPEEK